MQKEVREKEKIAFILRRLMNNITSLISRRIFDYIPLF